MFIDQTKIFVKAGSGGKGCISFYRDKYSRQGTPNGGRGGKGADIVVVADRNLHTLLDFKYNRHFKGINGTHGSSNNKKGRDAPDCIIRVPCGALIWDVRTGCLLRDLVNDKDQVIVARGGQGGSGNSHHREATEAGPGEEKELLFDLRLIAQAGIIGFPNVGKSTLISVISNARPKIAPYPFTTKSPSLGVVRVFEQSFVIADIPGLIEGSSGGRGLGDQFLRHVERTKVLVHLLDMSGFEGRDPVEDYRTINKELKLYGAELFKKPQIIAANKMDLEGAQANLQRFRKTVKKKVYPVSALKREGVEGLIEAVFRKL